MRIANGSRSSCSIQRDFITCRDSSGRAIQSDSLPGITAQCHAVIQGNLVVHRSVCIGSLSDCRIFAISADGDRLGGDFLDIADIGTVGVCVIYRVARFIRAGCAAGYLCNLLATTADAAGGDAAASSQPKTTAEVTDVDGADEDVMIIRISIPSGLNFSLKPGMKAVVKFAMNG